MDRKTILNTLEGDSIPDCKEESTRVADRIVFSEDVETSEINLERGIEPGFGQGQDVNVMDIVAENIQFVPKRVAVPLKYIERGGLQEVLETECWKRETVLGTET